MKFIYNTIFYNNFTKTIRITSKPMKYTHEEINDYLTEYLKKNETKFSNNNNLKYFLKCARPKWFNWINNLSCYAKSHGEAMLKFYNLVCKNIIIMPNGNILNLYDYAYSNLIIEDNFELKDIVLMIISFYFGYGTFDCALHIGIADRLEKGVYLDHEMPSYCKKNEK